MGGPGDGAAFAVPSALITDQPEPQKIGWHPGPATTRSRITNKLDHKGPVLALNRPHTAMLRCGGDGQAIRAKGTVLITTIRPFPDIPRNVGQPPVIQPEMTPRMGDKIGLSAQGHLSFVSR